MGVGMMPERAKIDFKRTDVLIRDQLATEEIAKRGIELV